MQVYEWFSNPLRPAEYCALFSARVDLATIKVWISSMTELQGMTSRCTALCCIAASYLQSLTSGDSEPLTDLFANCHFWYGLISKFVSR